MWKGRRLVSGDGLINKFNKNLKKTVSESAESRY